MNQQSGLDVKRLNLKFRSSLRGIKRCSSCGQVNGQRAAICRNEQCPLRKKLLEERLRFDPVQLHVNGKPNTSTCLFSLRCKERKAQPRSFVEISETPLTFDLDEQSTIVKRNAICYVDTCKYDATDAVGVICKHSKACLSASSMPQAEVYPITREVIFNLNVGTEQKQRLWEMSKVDEHYIPAVQCINSCVFAVKCIQSKIFPAGRLHVTAVSNAMPTKKSTYACACKKLKIIVEPDNSVVMQEDVCDHILLVLAAVLSKQNGKVDYANFTNALSDFWMPTALETPVLDASKDDAFLGMSINIGGSGAENDTSTADDIFIFGDEFLTDSNIPDFSDIVLDITPSNAMPGISAQQDCSDFPSVEISDIFQESDPMPTSICTNNQNTEKIFEVSDCNIELMDQFELTDQIDFCSDEIVLPEESNELFENNSISILSSPLSIKPNAQSVTINTFTSNNAMLPILSTSAVSNATTIESPENAAIISSELQPQLNTIEMPTIAVVKMEQYPMNATDFVPEAYVQKSFKAQKPALKAPKVEKGSETLNGAPPPTLQYSDWLNYVIEIINESIDIVQETEVRHSFHVHEDIFAHFSKSFSIGAKMRVPNSTTVIKHGKLKGKCKYSWFFPLATTVQRIFTTSKLSLTTERFFERTNDDTFTPYVQRQFDTQDKKHKRIFPKLQLYAAYICFDSNDSQHKKSFKIEWVPNVFPHSRFGQLNVEFSLGIREPHKHITSREDVLR